MSKITTYENYLVVGETRYPFTSPTGATVQRMLAVAGYAPLPPSAVVSYANHEYTIQVGKHLAYLSRGADKAELRTALLTLRGTAA